ncbi:MAG TPA: hypothetical protein ENK84_09845 [Desulfobulbus sp.]|nr:hypothetical protein [Desulfobulbus sp.]
MVSVTTGGLLCALLLVVASPAHAWNGRVLRILTGDTFIVSWKNQTRTITLYGINCPDPQTMVGQKAKRFTETRIKGKGIKINPMTTDSRGIIVTMVFFNGQNFNEFLLRSGYGVVNREQCHTDECPEWLRFEHNAFTHHRGIWADIELQSILKQ